MRPSEYIAVKRDGHELTREQITTWIHSYTKGEIADYQMAAWLMAVYLKGMTAKETSALTDAMISSGESLDLSAFGHLTSDKHSTGGVGDKTSLILGPLAAACGIKVAKMSGRGLSHTGGTIDKLEAIEHLKTGLTTTELLKQVEDIGIVICGQTGDLAPADKLLYALRDVTATVDSLPLIAASIMSKKIAAGAHNIVLDVKVGEGAFMKTIDEAISLASMMVAIGSDLGRNVVAYITDMNEPLGRTIGNAVEVQEAVETLKGQGPKDLTDVCIVLATEMVHLAKQIPVEQAHQEVTEALASGRALHLFQQMVQAQEGIWDEQRNGPKMQSAPVEMQVLSRVDGYVDTIHALQLGSIAMELGAGRVRKEDAIDPSVGIVLQKQKGELCKIGEPLATIFARSKEDAKRAAQEIVKAIDISTSMPKLLPHYYAKVSPSGVERIS